ncbi:thiolase C-terminal domain-containing protein [Cryptosporangium sp. NPDC051539]|uniref:thiolase C-terminal domain-containing protein n=1 Tax=Cryptosporangium sp. NPDC051539 TaxID=3363962 RepID=UPI00379412B1
MSRANPPLIVGASETTGLGTLPTMSNLDLNVDAACNALADAGIDASEIDGIASAGSNPVDVAKALGIAPGYVDSTMVGGCSPLVHVRHALAAIETGRATTVLVTHGESGRSRVSGLQLGWAPDSDLMQFEYPYGPVGAPGTFGMGLLRYMKEFGLTHEQLASVPVMQRRWAALNPRAAKRDPITVEDVFASPILAYPIHRLETCLVTDGGGALVITTAERAADLDLPQGAITVLGGAEAPETPMVSMMEDLTTSRAFRDCGRRAFGEAGITPADVDHLMLYDAFAFLPLYALEDLGFLARGEAGPFIEAGRTAPGGELPMNTNGGGLSYTHTGMYGMFAVQESIRQLRGIAAAQQDGIEISVAHAVGGFFWAAATLVLARA